MIKRSLWGVVLLVALGTNLQAIEPVEKGIEKGEEWMELSSEVKDELIEKLEESREFTEEQLEVIQVCFEESSFKDAVNCFSSGGVDKASELFTIVEDELGHIRERICGESTLGNRDQCDRVKDSLAKLKSDLQSVWYTMLDKGKQYLEEKNRLLFMKRKICKKINQEGCYQWLNERIEIKCNPKTIGNDPETIEQCKLDVSEAVWRRLNEG